MSNDAAADSPKPKNSKRDWIIRGVIFVPLLILLALAWLDNQAKQNATGTFEAIKAAQKEIEGSKEKHEMQMSDIKDLIKGNPTTEEITIISGTQRNYQWKGIFRTYSLILRLDRGENPVVEELIPHSEITPDDLNPKPAPEAPPGGMIDTSTDGSGSGTRENGEPDENTEPKEPPVENPETP